MFPWIGAKPVAELTAPELLAALCRIEERGHLDMAQRTLQVCGRVLPDAHGQPVRVGEPSARRP